MSEMVNHPAHYTFGQYEVLDVIEDWGLEYHEGNVVKYVARAKHKGNRLQDLKKARVYLNRKIALLERAEQDDVDEDFGETLHQFVSDHLFIRNGKLERDEGLVDEEALAEATRALKYAAKRNCTTCKWNTADRCTATLKIDCIAPELDLWEPRDEVTDCDLKDRELVDMAKEYFDELDRINRINATSRGDDWQSPSTIEPA
jgi:hypothetical protein